MVPLVDESSAFIFGELRDHLEPVWIASYEGGPAEESGEVGHVVRLGIVASVNYVLLWGFALLAGASISILPMHAGYG